MGLTVDLICSFADSKMDPVSTTVPVRKWLEKNGGVASLRLLSAPVCQLRVKQQR